MVKNVNLPTIFAEKKCTSLVNGICEEGVSKQHENENLAKLKVKGNC